MEGVNIAIPAVVGLSKLMGSEGFGGGGGGSGVGIGVSVIEAVTCDTTDGVSVVVGSSIDGCISFLGRKDVSVSPIPSESYFLEKTKHANEISVIQHVDATEEMKIGGKNSSPLVVEPSIEGKQKQKRSYKVSRSNSGSVKRSRIARMEVPANEAGLCGANEKSQLTKQKNSSSTKRSDKRNGKIASRNKSDSFSFKAGLSSFNSSGGGNSFLGLYGLKSDLRDVTEGMEELSVNELLNGSYMCPSFSQHKKAEDIKADSNESILHSVKKAVSVLMLPRPIKGQSSVEVKVSSNQKVLTYSFVSSLSPSSRRENDEDIACASDISSCNKAWDQNTKDVTTPHILLDSPLHQPKHVLERLSLPPAQDLETLLLDVTKQSGPSKSNPDLRGKMSQRTGLPPFPWSNVNGSHCKSTDTNKPSSSKTSCQGRWVKMGDASNTEITAGFLKDFESLAFDSSLVPLVSRQIRSSEDGSRASASVIVPLPDHGLTMSYLPLKVPSESGCSLKSKTEDDLSPRVLAAARTLCDIATQSLKQNPNGILRPSSKPSKSKMNVKSIGGATISNTTSDNNRRKLIDEGLPLPLKKPKLHKNSDKDKDRDHPHHNNGPLRLLSWSIPPRSSRTAPFNSLRHSFSETKCSNGNIVKQQPSYRLPPPPSSRITADKSRKVVSVELNGEGSKLS
ncbi:uncharacterized protein LOC124927466 isoform X2 [Impatiens glandulifera]|uniref:uncharacterized protein LOC124927466 isoform X2 n=1 Tax=Impatiens glandulifera TaxID=253017 RepID=UPI001FB08492|nr:uncharacterized protein LOC124927466 isoform X2 [Impatiens glandulifera]